MAHSPSSPGRAIPRRPRARFILPLAAGGAILLVIASILVCWKYLRDEPPPQDADLLVQPVGAPPGQNGYAQLTRIPAAALDEMSFAIQHHVSASFAETVAPGSNPAAADAFLAQARPALAPLDEILSYRYFVSPGKKWNDDGHFTAPSLQDIIEALDLSTRRYQDTGDFAAAARELARLHLLAARLAEPGPGGQRLDYARQAEHGAVVRTASLLNESALTAATQSALAANYDREIPWAKALQQNIPFHYQEFVRILHYVKNAPWNALHASGGSLTSLNARDFWTSITLKENATRRRLAPLFRAAQPALDGPYAAIPADLRRNWFDRTTPEYAIEKLADIFHATYASMAEDRLIQTGLGLRRYFDEHHALPPTLDALVPSYLPAVPLDPFDGKPLRYNAATGVVYSVGTSLKDQGGILSASLATDPEEVLKALLDDQQPRLILKFQHAATIPHAASPP